MTRLEGTRVNYPTNLVAQLEAREISQVGAKLAKERGLQFVEIGRGEHVEGTLVGSTKLASGKFAVIDSGRQLSLVPWNDVLESRMDRFVKGVSMGSGGIDRKLGRNLGIGM